MAETRINTECFLPVREGVSLYKNDMSAVHAFPPCTGGCIEQLQSIRIATDSFLPVREGVSDTE